MSISGIGNYLIESGGKLTPICTSSFNLIKKTSNRQHLCTNYQTGISVTESSDIVEDSWILTIDEVIGSHYTLSNLFSFENLSVSSNEESSEIIIYDGVSPRPDRYFNLTNPDEFPEAGDNLFAPKLINTRATATDNSTNLEKNHKFYGTFFDNSGIQYLVQINKMRRVSGFSLNTESPTSVSFITDEIIIKIKDTQVVTLDMPQIPENWVQIGDGTSLYVYGRVLQNNDITLKVFFQDGVVENQIINANSGYFNFRLILDPTASFGPSEIKIFNNDTNQQLYSKIINIVPFAENVITIDNSSGFISGANNNFITGVAPSGVPLTLNVNYGSTSFNENIIPINGRWKSGGFNIPLSQSSVPLSITASSSLFPTATATNSITKKLWSLPTVWPENNIYYSFNNPPNEDFTLRLKNGGNTLYEIINKTDNKGFFYLNLDLEPGPQLDYELITSSGTELGTISRPAAVTPSFTVTSTPPYYSNISAITGTVTAPVGTPVLVGYVITGSTPRFINFKNYTEHNGTINFSLDIFPASLNQKTSIFTSNIVCQLVVILPNQRFSQNFTVTPGLSIGVNNETVYLATTEVFNISILSQNGNSKNYTTNAFGVITTDSNVTASSLTKTITVPSTIPLNNSISVSLASPALTTQKNYLIRSHLLAFTKAYPVLVLNRGGVNVLAEGTGRVAGANANAFQAPLTGTVAGVPQISTFNVTTSNVTKLWRLTVTLNNNYIQSSPYSITISGAGQPAINFSGVIEMALESDISEVYRGDINTFILLGPNDRLVTVSSPLFDTFEIYIDSNNESFFSLPQINTTLNSSYITFDCGTQTLTKNIKILDKVFQNGTNIRGPVNWNEKLSLLVNSNTLQYVDDIYGIFPTGWQTFISFNNENKLYKTIDIDYGAGDEAPQSLQKINYSNSFSAGTTLPSQVTRGSSYTIEYYGTIGDTCNIKIEGLNSGVIFSDSQVFTSFNLQFVINIPPTAAFDLLTISANNIYTNLEEYTSQIVKVQSNQSDTIIEKGLQSLYGWYSAAIRGASSIVLRNINKPGFGSFVLVENTSSGGLTNYSVPNTDLATFKNIFNTNKIDQISSVYQYGYKVESASGNSFIMSDFDLNLSNEFTFVQYFNDFSLISSNDLRFVMPLAILNESKILNNRFNIRSEYFKDFDLSVVITGQRNNTTVGNDSFITCNLFNESKSAVFFNPDLFLCGSLSVLSINTTGVVFITTYKKDISGDEIKIYANGGLIASFKFNNSYNISGRVVSCCTDASLLATGLFKEELTDLSPFMKTSLAEATAFKLRGTTSNIDQGFNIYPNTHFGKYTGLYHLESFNDYSFITSVSTNPPLKVFKNNKTGYFKFNGSNQIQLTGLTTQLSTAITLTAVNSVGLGLILRRDTLNNETVFEAYNSASNYYKIEFIGATTLKISTVTGFWTVVFPSSLNDGLMSIIIRNFASTLAYTTANTGGFKIAMNNFVPTTATYTASAAALSGGFRASVGNGIFSNNFFTGDIYTIQADTTNSNLIAPGTSTTSPVISSTLNIAEQNASFAMCQGFPELADLIQPTRPIIKLYN